MNRRQMLPTCLLAALLVSAAPTAARAEGSWEAGGKAKLQAGYDDNAGQSFADKQAGALSRLLLNGEAGYRAFENQRFGAELAGGLDKYLELYRYDRAIGEGEAYWRRDGDFTLGLSASGRVTENFHEQWRDYSRWRGAGQAGYAIAGGPRLATSFGIEDFNSQLGKPLDFISRFYDLQLTQPLGPELFAGAYYRFLRREYYAHARKQGAGDQTFLSPDLRKDDWNMGALFAGGGGELLWRAEYAYLDLASNSFGASWTAHRFAAAGGWQPSEETTVLLSFALQVPRYRNLRADIVSVEQARSRIAGEEDENLNSATVQISRTILPNWELSLSFSRFSNEFSQAPYFNRDLLFLGLEYGFF